MTSGYSMYAAQAAGPEAIVAWIVGGAALTLIALVMAELGGARPESGGLVRWPFYTSGRLVATMAGWGIWIAYATNPPSESAAMLQYLSKYVPGIFGSGALTPLGVLFGAVIMALSGEARNPRRDVPRAVLMSLALSTVLYILLQVVFVGAVPGHFLIHGWHGVSFSSPFAQLAVAVNLTWLSWALYADAIGSPAGSALAFTASIGREAYAMAKNRFLPVAIARVHPGSGIPRRALVINFVIGLAFLAPLHSWQSIVAATAELGLIAYALPSVSAVAFARAGVVGKRTIPGVRFLAPVAFVLATLILYWATWKELRIALPVLLVSVVVYAYQQWRSGVDWQDARLGAWLVVYLALVLLVSAIGSSDFGGLNLVPAPWDSALIAAIGLAAYERGVRDAVRHLAAHPAPEVSEPPASGRAAAAPDMRAATMSDMPKKITIKYD